MDRAEEGSVCATLNLRRSEVLYFGRVNYGIQDRYKTLDAGVTRTHGRLPLARLPLARLLAWTCSCHLAPASQAFDSDGPRWARADSFSIRGAVNG